MFVEFNVAAERKH